MAEVNSVVATGVTQHGPAPHRDASLVKHDSEPATGQGVRPAVRVSGGPGSEAKVLPAASAGRVSRVSVPSGERVGLAGAPPPPNQIPSRITWLKYRPQNETDVRNLQ